MINYDYQTEYEYYQTKIILKRNIKLFNLKDYS